MYEPVWVLLFVADSFEPDFLRVLSHHEFGDVAEPDRTRKLRVVADTIGATHLIFLYFVKADVGWVLRIGGPNI